MADPNLPKVASRLFIEAIVPGIWKHEVTLGGFPGAEKLSLQCGSKSQEWRCCCSGRSTSVVESKKVSRPNVWHRDRVNFLHCMPRKFLAICLKDTQTQT